MILSRSTFFALLFIVLVGPFLFYKMYWISGSNVAVGIVQFTGHGNLGSVMGISSYPVIKFTDGKDSVFFNGNIDAGLKANDHVPVRYQRVNPSDAKMDTFVSLWGDTMAYSMGPVLVFLAVFFMPDLFPRRSRIKVGGSPFLELV